jgi:hypothetical protein
MLSAEQYEKDAAALRKAMKGWGTDEAPIINLTANRTNADRQQIIKFYKSSFGRDVIKDLEDELSGNLKKGIVAMYRTPIDYDVTELYWAMKGAGTNEETLIEIIGTRNNETLKKIKLRFKELYQKELEEWLKDETSGEFKKLLIALVQCNRSDTTTLDENKLDKDVKDLYEAGEGKWGTNSDVFNKIFSLRSPEELRYINKAYCKQMGKDLFKVIDSEFSGDAQKLYKTVLHAVINATDYFAERIRWACKGWGTNDDVLIRVLVSRDEIDLKQIKEIYPKKFGKTLYQEIKDETSGDYKNLLMAIAMTD